MAKRELRDIRITTVIAVIQSRTQAVRVFKSPEQSYDAVLSFVPGDPERIRDDEYRLMVHRLT
jgi:hypothetical protein